MTLASDSTVAGDVVKACRMTVIGLGGGGCNAVASMIGSWASGPRVAGVNTDAQALQACAIPEKIQIGRSLTHGLGAGGDSAVGKLAAEEDTDRLRELVSQTDVVFLVVALGGGTGTGAAPLLARLAREERALTLCFATLPFEFEGERRRKQAEEGLRALRQFSDVTICLPNQRLLERVEDQTSLVDAFRESDIMLGVGIRALWQVLTQTGIINLSFADLRHLADNSGGSCVFGYGEGRGPNKTDQALNEIRTNPLLERGAVISQAGALMISLVGGRDLTLVDVQKIMSQITAITRPGVRLYMGAAVDDTWSDRLAITVLAAENWQGEAVGIPFEPGREEDEMRGDVPAAVRRGEVSSAARAVQAQLNFEPQDRGRFKNVEPTLIGGQDLDIPTFIRRGIKLSIDK